MERGGIEPEEKDCQKNLEGVQFLDEEIDHDREDGKVFLQDSSWGAINFIRSDGGLPARTFSPADVRLLCLQMWRRDVPVSFYAVWLGPVSHALLSLSATVRDVHEECTKVPLSLVPRKLSGSFPRRKGYDEDGMPPGVQESRPCDGRARPEKASDKESLERRSAAQELDYLGFHLLTLTRMFTVTKKNPPRMNRIDGKLLKKANQGRGMVSAAMLVSFCDMAVSLTFFVPLERFYSRSLYN